MSSAIVLMVSRVKQIAQLPQSYLKATDVGFFWMQKKKWFLLSFQYTESLIHISIYHKENKNMMELELEKKQFSYSLS